MKKLIKYSKIFIYIGTLLSLVSVCFIFAPFFQEYTLDQTPIIYHGYEIIFGFTVSTIDNGIVYSQSFMINLYLIIANQLLILGCLGIFIGRKSSVGVIFGVSLSIVGTIGVWLTPLFVMSVNPSFNFSGVNVCYGYYLEAIVASLSSLITIFAIILINIGKKQKQL